MSSYHIYAYYNQEIDQLNKVADAFAKNTEGIFINKQNRNAVFKNNLLNDTIRICTFNRSYGRYCFASSVNADYYDAITVTISSKYYKGEKDVNLDFRDNAECVETNFGAQHCGKYFVKFKKVKNGFVTYQEDSIDLKWKADPAFEYEITL